MRHLLSPENAEVLLQMGWSNVLLGFDFDGTLSPIVADRDAARMRKRTAQLLTRLCALYPVAVISGRSRADVAARLQGVPVAYVVGNHGLEPGGNLRRFQRESKAARRALEVALQDLQGLDIEDKRYSLALHYRRSRQKRALRAAIEHAVAALPVAMRTIAGKLVLNVVPADAPTKADALLALRSRQGSDTVLYVGDDVTDEDVFEVDQPGRLLSVRVGESHSSAAPYFLRSQREIDQVLTRLIAAGEERKGQK
jgi:trehalose 6-phosphate phosphatase